MKNILNRRWLALTLATTLSWTVLPAQDSNQDEPVFELSPFEVNSADDTGYNATSTLSGSRLNTNLSDVAGSVTVLTQDFMDDLGVTDVAGALSMVAGVETDLTTDTTQPHLGQGFIGNDFGDQNTFEGSVRVRGLGRATQSANFLEVLGPIDRYNMERVEFLRGPNALLFGLGQPGGVINYSTKKAYLHKDVNKVDLVFDQFGSHRAVADFGRVIMKDKLAVRAVGLYSDSDYMFKTATNRDSRYYLTSTYKPFKNTTISAYYENIDVFSRRPNYRVPQDNVSDWLREYNKAHEMYSGQELEDYLNRNLVWDASWSITSNGRAPGSPDIILEEHLRTNPDGTPATFAGDFRRPQDGRDRGTYAYYSAEDWNNPINGYITLSGTVTTSGGNATNNPYSRLQFHRSAYPWDRRDTSYLDPQILTEDIFPILDYSLDTLPGNGKTTDDEKYGFNITQRVTDNFYLSFDYLKEYYTTRQVYAPLAQTQAISLDINKYLPGSIDNAGAFTGSGRDISIEDAVVEAQRLIDDPGTSAEDVASNQLFLQSVANREPNPNYLRPFFHGRSIGGFHDFETDAYLAQAAYDLDFTENSGILGWLGRHRMSAFASGNKNEHRTYRFTSVADYIPGITGNANRSHAPRRIFWPTFYIGDPVQPGDTGLNITGLPSTTIPNENEELPYYYFDNSNGGRGEWKTSTIKWRQTALTDSQAFTKTDATGMGASIQSFFWDGRIVATFGYREDTVDESEFMRIDDRRLFGDADFMAAREARGLVTNSTNDIILTDIEGDGSSLNDWVLESPRHLFKRTVPLETKGLVFHITPWLRVFGNLSENFALTSPTQDGFFRTNPSQAGETEEYGIGLELFDSKLTTKLTFYETKQTNEPISNIRLRGRWSGFENQLFNLFANLDQRGSEGKAAEYDIGDWERIDGIDADGNVITEASGVRAPALDENGDPIFDQDGFQQWEYDGQYDTPSNPGVSQDSVSEGWEFSFVYNPVRNLRILGSVSKLENQVANKEGQVLDVISARTSFYAPIFAAGYHTNGDNDSTVYIDPDDVAPDYVLQPNEQFGNPQPNENLLIDNFYESVGAELINEIRSEGTSNIGISEYSARVTAAWTFYEGFLDGFTIGTNLRWESGKVLGYPVVPLSNSDLPDGFPSTDINGNGQVDSDEYALFTDDLANPYEGDSHMTGGLMIAYRTKIMDGKVDWRLQLNVNNLFKQGDDFRVIRVNPDGSPILGINVPTTYQLTSSFSW